MLVIQESTSKLLTLERKKTLKHDALLAFQLIFSVLFALSGVVSMVTFEVTRLKCDRVEPTQVNCQLTSSILLEKKTTSIKQLKSAEVQVHKDSEGDTYEKVFLVTKDDYISVSLEGEQAKKINTFISNPEDNFLRIEHNNFLSKSINGIIYIFFGSVWSLPILFIKVQTSCIFDKNSGRMYLAKKNYFKSETRELMLDEIKEARVVEETDSDGDITHTTNLILKSGDQITLQISSYESEQYKIAQFINQFIGIKNYD